MIQEMLISFMITLENILSSKARDIVKLYYGIDIDKCLDYDEIASKYKA